ncbi:MAG: hypothetical protein ACI4OO_01995 [Otoolea sp.]
MQKRDRDTKCNMGTKKKCLGKRGLLLAVTAAAILSMPHTALAEEEDRTPIGEITIDISSSIDVGDVGSEVDASTDSDECEITTVDVTNEPSDKWKHKDKPKLEITLEADHDYYFASGFNKKKVNLTGDSATVTSVKRKGKEELRVIVTLKALKGTDSDYELDVDEAEWDQLDGVAEWNDSEDAKYYELRLYRDGKFVTNLPSVHNTSCSLGKYLHTAGSYTFEVRAVYSGSRKGDWQESDTFEVSSEKAAELAAASEYVISGTGPASGTWMQIDTGYRYVNPDQTYTVNNWQQIDGMWYYFDENGFRKTGWVLWKDKWYYLNELGVMLSNTVTPDGKKVGADGAMYE